VRVFEHIAEKCSIRVRVGTVKNYVRCIEHALTVSTIAWNQWWLSAANPGTVRMVGRTPGDCATKRTGSVHKVIRGLWSGMACRWSGLG
jgi:hypothetical protein